MHFVLRGGNHGSPITNLHLGNTRLDSKRFIESIPAEKWEAVKAVCERVAKECFSESLYLGLDVLITPDLEQVYILEVNAFGDLLPRITHEGFDTYSYEIIECFKRTANRKKYKTN